MKTSLLLAAAAVALAAPAAGTRPAGLGLGDVALVGPAAGELVDLSVPGPTEADERASLSPDGRWVAVIRTDAHTTAPWLVPTDGSGPRLLVAPREHENFADDPNEIGLGSPSWKPNSQEVAVPAYSSAACGPVSRNCVVWSTAVTDLTGHRDFVVPGIRAVWSPSGRAVAFLAGSFSLSPPSDWRIDVVGSFAPPQDTKRMRNCWGNAAWRLDGARLALEEIDCGAGGDRVHVLGRATGGDVFVRRGCCPAWSADGKFLALRTVVGGSTIDIVSNDGRGRTTLARAAGVSQWSPTGHRLAWVRNSGGNRTLVVSDAWTRRARTVTASLAPVHDLRWSKDGRLIALVQRTRNASLVAVVSVARRTRTVLYRDTSFTLDLLGWARGGRIAVETQ